MVNQTSMYDESSWTLEEELADAPRSRRTFAELPSLHTQPLALRERVPQLE